MAALSPSPSPSPVDSRYLALWKRMNAVAEAYSRADRAEEADYCIADFFATFADIEELERHVGIAEASAREQRVL